MISIKKHMKNIGKIIGTKLGPILVVLSPIVVRAAYPNPTPYENIPDFVEALLLFLVKIGALLLVLMVIYAGFMFITANGQPDKLKTAKSAFLWVVIGGALVLGAWALSLVVGETIQDL